jgi:hypothetical protein
LEQKNVVAIHEELNPFTGCTIWIITWSRAPPARAESLEV